MPGPNDRTFSIRALTRRDGRRPIPHVLATPFDRIIGLNAISEVYTNVNAQTEGPFARRALHALGIEAELPAADLERIPKSGPLIVAANHPLGGADGLLMLDTLLRVRPDVKLLANAWLGAIPELAQHVIAVDVFGPTSPKNAAALRAAFRWLKDGGCLATFPAGEVSRLRVLDREISDKPWSGSIATLSGRTGATVLPLCFDASNSWLFQTFGQLHALIRTALLPRELLWKRNSTVRVRIGSPIAPERLKRFATPEEASAFVRARVYLLAGRPTATSAAKTMAPVAPPEDPIELRHEIDALPPDRTLARLGDQRVLLVRAEEIPRVLREIGRLREVTFRAVGEGTGQALDLDKYDETYRHLFVYDDKAGVIVGAYRLGLTDELVPAHGLASLYTSTLFTYQPSELQRLIPGIELGRSFVRTEYQRHNASLLLLWQGIGRFAGNNPRYRYLFGTASISDTYPSVTKQLLVRFISATFGPGEWARVARPTTPPRFPHHRQREADLTLEHLDDIRDADELVASIDPQGRGIPTLLRMYLRLGARLVGFNVDPAFGDALDGLIVVDLVRAPGRTISRYMGDELYRAYMRHHQSGEASAKGTTDGAAPPGPVVAAAS